METGLRASEELLQMKAIPTTPAEQTKNTRDQIIHPSLKNKRRNIGCNWGCEDVSVSKESTVQAQRPKFESPAPTEPFGAPEMKKIHAM